MIRANRFPACFMVLAAGGIGLAFASPRLAWIGIAAEGVAILWLAWHISARGSRSDLLAAIALNQVAAVALWLDKFQLVCAGGLLAHVLQPHSLWHGLCALSLLFFYRYERQLEHALGERDP